jgi:hypothetical protein
LRLIDCELPFFDDAVGMSANDWEGSHGSGTRRISGCRVAAFGEDSENRSSFATTVDREGDGGDEKAESTSDLITPWLTLAADQPERLWRPTRWRSMMPIV